MKRSLLSSVFAALSILTAHAGGEGWVSDFKAAATQAKQEKKSLLLEFTGSDWCPPCQDLSQRILSQDSFKKPVSEKFVLVRLDFPEDESKVAPRIAKQNQALQDIYQIQGYPTILLTDADGRPFANTGHRPEGPEDYAKHIFMISSAQTQRDSEFGKAAKLQGVKKAQALYAGLQAVPQELHVFYQDIINQIMELDPEDKTGIQAIQKLQQSYLAAVESGNMGAALKLVDDFIAKTKPQGTRHQELLFMRIEPLMESMNFDAVMKTIDGIIAIAPDSNIGSDATQLKEQLPMLVAQMIIQKKNAEAGPKAAQ